MTTTDTVTTTDTIQPIPTYDEVIIAICDKAGCTPEKAEAFLNYLVTAKNSTALEEDRYQPYHLTAEDIEAYHSVLETVMPANTRPRYGDDSAHDLINRHLLNTNLGEMSFVHSGVDGKVEDCYVAITFDTIG